MPKSAAQLNREIAAFIQEEMGHRRILLETKDPSQRAALLAKIKTAQTEVSNRRPAPPKYPEGTGLWRVLDD